MSRLLLCAFVSAALIGCTSCSTATTETPATGWQRPACAGASVAAPAASAAPVARIRYPADRVQSPVTASVARHLLEIAAGAPGRANNVFIKVGDSITANDTFLGCFAAPPPSWFTQAQYVDLQGNAEWRKTVEHFFTCDQAKTPFDRVSLAARVGVSAVWPLEGTPSPLSQEIAAMNPRFAVVMYGTNDLGYGGSFNADTFGYKFTLYPQSMLDLVDALIAQGIVPILSTIPTRHDDPGAALIVPSFNAVVRAIAESRQVPLIDLQPELDKLANKGLGGDNIHLTAPAVSTCALDAESLKSGMTVRNALTLEALNRVRKIFAESAASLDPDNAAPSLEPAGEGSAASPFVIGALPFSDVRSIATGAHADLAAYSGCAAAPAQPGPETVYRLTLTKPTKLRAFVTGRTGSTRHFHVNLLADPASAATCQKSEPVVFGGTFPAGQYAFAIDTEAAAATDAGEYLFAVVECVEGDTSCN